MLEHILPLLGSVSVHGLMVSPVPRGTYQAAICQSQSMLSLYTFVRDNNTEAKSHLLKEKLGCGGNKTPQEELDCLQSVPKEEIIDASRRNLQFNLKDFEDELKGVQVSNKFYPVMDSYAKEPFIPADYLDEMLNLQVI